MRRRITRPDAFITQRGDILNTKMAASKGKAARWLGNKQTKYAVRPAWDCQHLPPPLSEKEE
jgi:hypothetical protein